MVVKPSERKWNGFPENLHLVNRPEKTIHSTCLRDLEVLRLSSGEDDVGDRMFTGTYGQRVGPFFTING